MLNTSDLKRKLESAFPEDQVAILTEVLIELHAGLATSVDMQDLKDAVKELGGLSNTVGYTLENAAYRALPALLEVEAYAKERGIALYYSYQL